MPQSAQGIYDWSIDSTPVSVIDFETTGLNAGTDRVIEVSIVRVDPGSQPKLVLDTLVNPRRPVAATEIHGITDADVRDAPTFDSIAGNLVDAIAGSVVAAYNVYFDIKFLDYELRAAGLSALPPHICLMYMRPLLGLGKRCTLEDACQAHGLPYDHGHVAASDAHAAAGLLCFYRDSLKGMDVNTFGDLARLKKYKFFKSFAQGPLDSAAAQSLARSAALKSRSTPSARPVAAESATKPAQTAAVGLRRYWEGLKAALADLRITQDELDDLLAKKHEYGLDAEQIRALHARAFASVITQFTDDHRIDERECNLIRRVQRCLSQLGWAPGDASDQHSMGH
jgi:DNA polymerase-3 subunit epsilon